LKLLIILLYCAYLSSIYLSPVKSTVNVFIFPDKSASFLKLNLLLSAEDDEGKEFFWWIS